MEMFSSNTSKNLIKEEKWLLAGNSFEATKSVFNVTDENIVFQLLHHVLGIRELLKKLLQN